MSRPVETSGVLFLFPAAASCFRISQRFVFWTFSDERLHPSAEGAAAQQCGGITQRSQVWQPPQTHHKYCDRNDQLQCAVVYLNGWTFLTWYYNYYFWVIIELPPPSLQVYDQTSERWGYLQADQNLVAAKLTPCFFSGTETGTILGSILVQISKELLNKPLANVSLFNLSYCFFF